MKASQIITKVRFEINDTEKNFSDLTLAGFLNKAINNLASKLISAKDPTMVKETTLTFTAGLTDVPADYFSSCGAQPVYKIGNKFRVYGDRTTWTLRYFAFPQERTKTFVPADEVPCLIDLNQSETDILDTDINVKPIYENYLINQVSIIAQNRNEADVSQDIALLKENESTTIINKKDLT